VTKINFYDNTEEIKKNRATVYGISLNPKTKPRVAGEMPDSVSRWIDGELARAKRQTLMNLDAGEFFSRDTARLVGYIRGYDPRAGFSTGMIYAGNGITREDFPQVVRIHEDGRFECSIPMSYPVYQYVVFGNHHSIDFYIQPGQTLAMILDWEDFRKADRYRNIRYRFRDIQFRGGAPAVLNRELKAFDDSLPELKYRKIYGEMDKKAPAEFKTFYDELIADYSAAYRRQLGDGTLSGYARTILENAYKIRYAMYLLEYEIDYSRNHRDDPLPPAFYDFLQDIPMNDRGLLSTPSFSTFINRLEYCGPFFGTNAQAQAAFRPAKTYEQYLFEELALPKTPEDEAYMLMQDSLHIFNSMKDRKMQEKWMERFREAGRQFTERHGEARLAEYTEKYVRETAQNVVDAELWRLRDSVYLHELRLKPGIIYDLIKVRAMDFTFGRYNSDSRAGAQQLLDVLTGDFAEPFLREEAGRMFRKKLPDERPVAYELPDTYAASVFKEIIAPFKGKILLIDFWATTCGPCVYNIKNHRELREQYRDSPDAALIFITDEDGSPRAAYDKFVAEQQLTNSHYITADQYRYLRELFHFNGIPRYVLVDRDGRILDDDISSHSHEKALEEAIKGKI
ncbi:MAG: TlpA family protein disulfide reductase, partial [Tannerella sp.]|jgi:hypothetical protein|nr:TlpA family protein disulfide reductase [Tannerella sp.]